MEDILDRLTRLEEKVGSQTESSAPSRSLLQTNTLSSKTRIGRDTVETCRLNITCSSSTGDHYVQGDLWVKGSIHYQGGVIAAPPPPTPAPSFIPTTMPVPSPTPSPVVPAHFSCASLRSAGYAASGLYTVYPGRSLSSVPFTVYCDLASSDGFGWMLTYAYTRAQGANLALSPGVIPSGPADYAHTNVNQIPGYAETDIVEVRFFCTTTLHSRVIHFKTSNSFQAGVAFDGNNAGNSASQWTSGFTLLEGHTATLPERTLSGYAGSSDAFVNFPFYSGGSSGSGGHWAIREAGTYWCCDAGGTYADQGTQHQIWVRFGS